MFVNLSNVAVPEKPKKVVEGKGNTFSREKECGSVIKRKASKIAQKKF